MESLFDARESYKDLLRSCSFHGLYKWLIVHTFYIGLLYSTRMTLCVTVSGTFMNNPQDVAYNFIEEIAKNCHSLGIMQEIIEKSAL